MKKEEEYRISETEDISYELSVHDKRYDAAFFQQPTDTLTYRNIAFKALENKYTSEQILNPTKEQAEDMQNIMSNSVFEAMKKRLVWFTIVKNYGKFRISMYYENGYNMANGEDL